MWPTSIAVWNASVPPQSGQMSVSVASRRSANRGWKSRPASTPRRCQPSRFAPATNWPSRSVSSATTSPAKPTGPSEPPDAPNAARISSSVDGRDGPPIAASSFACSMPVVAADQREHDASVARRHRHRLRRRGDVDAEELGERLARRHAGRLDLARAEQRLREDRRRAACVGATSMSAAKSPFSQRDERVLARARRCEEVDATRAAHHPRLGVDRRAPRRRTRSKIRW